MSHSLREISFFFLSHQNTCQMAYYVISLVAYVKCWKWFLSFVHSHTERDTLFHTYSKCRMMTMKKQQADAKTMEIRQFAIIFDPLITQEKKKRNAKRNRIQSCLRDSCHDQQLLISDRFFLVEFHSKSCRTMLFFWYRNLCNSLKSVKCQAIKMTKWK